MAAAQPLGITDLVLRDAHQSLLATRMRIEDMLPIAAKLDSVGYWSLETWGGATFDACIRFLGEDPWERLRRLKEAMPNTPQQMLLRGQNILGYRHYADDVVVSFVERAAETGIDVFRIFDAMNDLRNLETAIKAALATGKHAQGAMSYTVSPVHSLDYWLDMGKRLEDMGSSSLCIKDMAGLLTPFVAEQLVGRLKEACAIPVALHSHATTGMSTATIVKAVEAGLDMVDASISSMSMTYGHSATESLVAIFEGTPRDTGLDLPLLEEIAAYFRKVRKKYAKFEGALRGIDSRILVAQVPGGMLTNMESQLREQGAADRIDEVLGEIPSVRKDLGYIPLVTPTSQIVGTQAVLNVLSGERYKVISREAAGVLRGEYGATPAPVAPELQARVLEAGAEPVSCRPADLLPSEMDKLRGELDELTRERELKRSVDSLNDVLTYALFPQVGLRFLENRDNPAAFEPPPWIEGTKSPAAPGTQPSLPATTGETALVSECYDVEVDGKSFRVRVTPHGAVEQILPAEPISASPSPSVTTVPSPLTGTIHRVVADMGQKVSAGDVLAILEAMKMETEVRSPIAGKVTKIHVAKGTAVHAGDPLIDLG